jgi:hypothetical protein
MSTDGPPVPDRSTSDQQVVAEALALTPAVLHKVRRLAWLYLAGAVALLPWIVYLAVTLPRRSLDVHYKASWVGFDLLLVIALVRTAYMAFKVDARIQLTATAAATLLIVDAWFDVTTSHGRANVLQALLLAVFAEIPIAIFCIYVARRVSAYVFELAHLERIGRGAPQPTDAQELHREFPDEVPEPTDTGKVHRRFPGRNLG